MDVGALREFIARAQRTGETITVRMSGRTWQGLVIASDEDSFQLQPQGSICPSIFFFASALEAL
jgi:hypothetical protein